MHKLALPLAALAMALFAVALPLHAPAAAQPYGMMGGPGTMYGQGYGPGMMYGPGYGHMMGPWMMGPGAYGANANLNLSTNDVKHYFERLIAIQGNSRIKVGDVKEKDADTIVADIVTKDNSSLVQRFLVNHHNGFYRPDEE